MARKKASSPEKPKIGIQPTCWTNDDFQEIGHDTPYQQILDEMKATGYAGGSTGHNYPAHRPSLLHDLKKRRLEITSTWVGTHFTAEGKYEATLEHVRKEVEFLTAVGATDIVVAELSGAVNQVRTKSVLEDRPIFNEAQWYLLVTGLNEAGRIARESGMQLCYHPHVGTGVQDLPEIDRLFGDTNSDRVAMCLDTGHANFAGVDAVDLTAKYISRIKHVHLKNVRSRVREKAVRGKHSFFQAIREGVFTVPGDSEGDIDFMPIFELLQENDYTGWIVVEAEQDPAKADPVAYAKKARDYIRRYLDV
jgi:inosose dehydratase